MKRFHDPEWGDDIGEGHNKKGGTEDLEMLFQRGSAKEPKVEMGVWKGAVRLSIRKIKQRPLELNRWGLCGTTPQVPIRSQPCP